VLDVGCGNGRFGVFLAQRRPDISLQYHGVDNNPALLEHARLAFNGLPQVSAVLEERDIIENPPHTGEYDLVAVFGVLHHIPGYEQRLSFIRSLAERVATGGMLAFACWRFYEYERFRERIVPWPEDIQVEANDYLLDWRRGQVSLRYCHYVDDAEHAALVAATGMHEVATYRADGHTGDANRYSLLRH
jgi:SAM-dependent methyltransferase